MLSNSKSFYLGENVKIGANVRFGNNVVIGNNCVIEDNVVLGNNVTLYEDSVILSNTHLFDNVVMGRMPEAAGGLSRKLKGNYGTTKIGRNCSVGVNAVVYRGVQIGDDVLLGDSCSIREECLVGNKVIVGRAVMINYNAKIGNGTKIMDCACITGNMVIGKDVFISMCVSSANDNTLGRSEYSPKHIKGPIIEDNARIGVGANLLPGTRIGENAIVGASAVVTKDVPQNAVVMGIPARIIRYQE